MVVGDLIDVRRQIAGTFCRGPVTIHSRGQTIF